MEKLFKCPNPVREFKIGKLFIMTQWASTIWGKDVNGQRETYYFKVNKVQRDESKGLNLIIWKLSVFFTILD